MESEPDLPGEGSQRPHTAACESDNPAGRAAIQGVKRNQDLPDLAPKDCFIAAEAVGFVVGRLARRKKQRLSSALGSTV
jgi:hypothetical protein